MRPAFGPRRLPSARAALAMVRWKDRGRTAVERAADISDLRVLARRRVPRPVFDFIEGGAGDETTLRRNIASFEEVSFVPRILRDVSHVETSTTLLGAEITFPVVLAPVGLARMAHRDGEIAAASAASRRSIPYCLSTMASASPEAVADHAPLAPKWFQLYLWRDRDASERLVRRAEAAGFHTLVVTVDVPVAGERLRDTRHGLHLPPSVPIRTAVQMLRRPGWVMDALTLDPVGFAALSSAAGDLAALANSILDSSATFAELEWLRRIWSGRILVKGVLSADDAHAAAGLGVDGVIVSNHGGRQLEYAISPLAVLREIRDRLGSASTLLLDGGIRSGAHVAAAVAAGADAVLIGRPYLYGLMAAGEDGVLRALDILKSGLVRTMALLGASRIADLSPEMVRLPGEVGPPPIRRAPAH